MNDTLTLAGRLRALDDARLLEVLHEREVRQAGIKDFFDLAEALLDGDSLQKQLGRLDRPTLATLAALTDLVARGETPTDADVAAHLRAHAAPGSAAAPVTAHLEHCRELLLVGVDRIGTDAGRWTASGALVDQLAAWPAFGLPDLAELAGVPRPPMLEAAAAPDDRAVDRVAAERAFAAAAEVAELLAEIEREPARELARGGLALPDTKRLANAASVDLETVARLIEVAADAGLVARESGHRLITDEGGDWLLASTAERWAWLALGWAARLSPEVHALLAERTHSLWGDGLRAVADWLYPAGGDWMRQRIDGLSSGAELLGITAGQIPSTPGRILLAEGRESATAAMAALQPPEVDHVYLQHDLSIVSPGPLSPAIDARLRTFADVESRALAATYRISTTSINRALAAGDTADQLREFLRDISLTGVPQPLDYLLGEAQTRFGLLRAGAATADDAVTDAAAQTYLRSDDAALLSAVLVDQGLAVLGLRAVTPHRLLSRFPLDVVFWNVSDARYPVAAEDERREVLTLRRRRHARSAAGAASDPLVDLLERLRLGSEDEPDDDDGAWLVRQLDTAIKAKVELVVTVRMQDGTTVDYLLAPTSVAGGRVRARDRRSDIERTLPLSSIAGLGPAR